MVKRHLRKCDHENEEVDGGHRLEVELWSEPPDSGEELSLMLMDTLLESLDIGDIECITELRIEKR